MRRAFLCAALCVLSLSITGCQFLWPFVNPGPTKTGAAALLQFKSEAEFKEYLARQARSSNSSQGGLGLFLPVGSMDTFSASPRNGAGSEDGAAAGSANDDYSTTNLQEEGVDESDVLKNDGQYFYLLKAGELRIAKVDEPNALAEVGRLEVEGQPDSLYLMDDTLVALSLRGGYYYAFGMAEDGGASPAVATASVPEDDWTNKTYVTLIDAADRTAPTVIKTYTLEGQLQDSRMIGGRLYLVLSYYPQLPPLDEIPDTPYDDLVPRFVTGDGAGNTSPAQPIASWSSFYRPADPDGYGMLTVVTIDTNDLEAEPKSVGVTADTGVVYASTEALYLTDTEWGYGPDTTEQTVIHKFAFAEEGATYVTSGAVPGRPLNQFSLSEYEGYLRIATTLGRLTSRGGNVSNHVFVLGEGQEGLDIVGEVRNIAPGEEIYSARFMGPKGFLVTFVKVDPLFTLDLSDPANPRLVGELKVPGYSNYIHLMDDDHLLTIGKDSEEVGGGSWYQGVKLSIFDVSDFANPREAFTQIIGGRGTESEALRDHKAFNYYAPKDVLAIPIVLYEGGQGGPTYGEHTFTGLYVYRVTAEEGFELLGRISTLADQQDQDYYWNRWTRGVFIGDFVYAATDERIRSAGIEEADTVIDTLELAE